MELQKAIQTIRDLCNKTVSRGCTEHEAMAAAAKIGQLLKVYNLSMDKVFLGEARCIEGVVATGRKRRHPIDYCMRSIAEFCDCKVWIDWEHAYHFFGLEPDVAMAKYLYGIIFDAIETATAAFKQSAPYIEAKGEYGIGTSRKTLSVSFQKGMANRISNRLREITQQRQVEESEESPAIMEIDPITGRSTSTSLVVMKQNKVESAWEQLGIRLKKAARSASYNDRSAYGAGQAAGDKVNLHRPMGGKVVGLLT